MTHFSSDYVSLFFQLQTIQCIDVAEQSLTALDILSRRHASAVLAAGGVSSCLQYMDFFSLPAQRSALSIAANCCYAVGTIDTDISGPDEEFRKFMKASLPVLSTRLHHHDKKCIETTCLCFVRLIDSFQQDSAILNDIASVDLLKNFQKLIVEPTSLLSSSMLVLVIHSMTVLCSKLRKYASQLLEDDITETLYYLLCGKPSDGKSETVELLPRGSQETQEIASFIVQLLPRLPKDDPVFCVRNGSPANGFISKTIAWQWSDNAGQWHSYKRHESRILEMAYGRGETEIDLHLGDRSVSISFDTMKLIDDNTGTNQPVQRILSTSNEDVHDESMEDIKSDAKEFPNFVRVLFSVVVELYNTSAGFPSVRHVCLHALQRMVYYSSSSNLSTILEKLSLSSQISSMLSNQDSVIVVSAVQLADLLMRKLPQIFKDMFVREGVVHRIKNLSQMVLPDDKRDASAPSTSRGSTKSSRKSATSKTTPYALREHHSSTKLRPRDQRGSSSSGRSSKVSKFAASFLSTMNPTSWKKSITSALSPKEDTVLVERSSHSRSSERSRHGNKHAQTPRSTDIAKSIETDKWLKKQANEFLEKHFKESQCKNDGKPDILEKLTETATGLSNSSDNAEQPLRGLCEILDGVEVSPFEMIQSGAISALLHYLTSAAGSDSFDKTKILDERIRVFLFIYAGLVAEPDAPITGQIINSVKSLPNLVRKLNQCFGRLEQFPVKSRELMSESANIYHALTSRQVKCQLQRHPDCPTARRWLSGPIKIDPLIQMRAIEKYLVAKGFGSAGIKQRLSASILFHDRGERDGNGNGTDDDDDDDDSDNEDIDEMALEDAEDFPDDDDDDHFEQNIFRYSRSSRRKQSADNATYSIEFYIGSNKLPRQMTIYQALQQFGTSSHTAAGSSSASSGHAGSSLLNDSGFWAKVHLLQYKLVKQVKDTESKTSVKSSKKSQSSKKVKDQSKSPMWFDGITPTPCNPMHNFLTIDLPSDFGPIDDPSVEVLALLRVLHAVSRYWLYLYPPNLIQTNRPLVAPSVFINNEVNAKCMHQLEDPLVVITGQLSPWVQQVGRACPFLLSFETRQLLFKVTAFERNRALQHLHDNGITRAFSAHLGLSSSSAGGGNRNSSNPFAPRIDKKKCSVSRKSLLQQAEKIIADHGSSLAMIEVDYENEVGTGLGPTLEFFTLISKEIQSTKLKLWREELTSDDKSVSDEKITADTTHLQEIELVKTVAGLFPRPLSHSAKHSQISRLTTKFKFLGKFLGKALLDGRLVDIPLSIACYRWLLGEEGSLVGMDLDYVDPGLASTFRKFCLVAHRREKILLQTPSEIESLEMDGCSIEDLGLDMCLPGYASVELMKGGKAVSVTAHNLDKYLNLLVHWTLHEGVKHQMNALKEGFQSVIHLTNLSYFYPEELDLLFCGSRYRPWDVQELSEACRPDHGYTQDSEAVKILYKVLASFDASEQRNFLQFVTGCPHLPFGGLRSLNPPLTVVRKACETSENPDDYLPSVMTCLNYVKLPEYSNEEVMRAKLKIAVLEGQKSFLLS